MEAMRSSRAAEEVALATGGEAAVELEAAAPTTGGTPELIGPISNTERDELRGRQEFLGAVDVRNLVPGPDGQMISGHNR